MKKRLVSTALGMAAVLLFSGCGNSIADLTEEETKLISEYAAVTLLKYDASNRSRLVDLSKYDEPAEEPIEDIPEENMEQEQPEDMNDPEAPPVIDNTVPETVEEQPPTMTINTALGLDDNLIVTYQGYELTDSYDGGSGGMFSLDAGTGKVLLVMKLALSNLGSEPQSADILHANASIRVTVNGDYTRTALMTMLTNDFATYSGTLAAGETEYLALVVEAEPDMVASIQSMSLTVRTQEGKCELALIP